MPVWSPPLTVKESDGTPSVGSVRILQVAPGTLTDNGAGDVSIDTSGSGVTDIVDIPTADTTDSDILAPDGAGGVEFRAPAGGSLGDGFTYLTKASDQNETTTGLHDDADLQFAVTAGKHYIMEAYLLLSGNNTTGDAQWAMAVSAGTMDGRGHFLDDGSTLASTESSVAAVAASATTAVAVGVNAAADPGMATVAKVHFAFRHNTTGGTFKIQFGVNTFSAGREARMMAGSYIRYRQTD